MKLIDISKQLEEITVQNDLDNLPKDLRSEELEKNLSLIYEKDRVLKIGIVGRVKAGKSSLLNALVFDGKDILPKAATPMTAALTRLEYGEVIEANVDFYTQEDIDSLKKNFDKYKEEFEKLKKQKFEELKNTQQRKLQVEILDESTKQEILQKAENIANREMKDKEELFSSYDQYSKIKASNLSLAELKEFENIQADNIDSLNKKLYDFVGADGEYMPFTKSVNIKLNDENLKDIEIIDTPGINDPISSREARTEDLLQECDVIFIVSPSGQFLSNEDMNLLDRITTKDGIQEIHIVASQIDNQLYGSEKENNNSILPKVLESLKQNLTKQIRNVLGDKKNQFEAKIYEKFMKNDVLYSSGATYSMLQRFEDKENWDANLEHIWKNLNEKYKDYFSDDESAKANLSLLANMKNIQSTLDEVRKEKAEIIKKRQDDVVKVKLNSLEEYHKTMINDIQQKIEKIKSSDIEDIKNKIDSSSKIRIEASETVNWEYEDYIEEFSIDLKNALNNQIKKDFNDSKNNIDDSQEIELESYTYDYGFFSWKFAFCSYR
jgi:predicted GTPase